MSLDYDLSSIKNKNEVCWEADDSMKPSSQTIIYLTMIVGINKITEDNWKDFFMRTRMYEAAQGGDFVSMKNGSNALTPERIREHIGLSTNAENIAITKFLKRVWERTQQHYLDLLGE